MVDFGVLCSVQVIFQFLLSVRHNEVNSLTVTLSTTSEKTSSFISLCYVLLLQHKNTMWSRSLLRIQAARLMSCIIREGAPSLVEGGTDPVWSLHQAQYICGRG